jgi:hypothetical protein
MTCNEAAEFVSALCDGEIIPRAAAEHVGSCATCRTRLKEYIGIGVELRRVASLDCGEEMGFRACAKQQGAIRIWWRKGWENMRIPRFAFVSLVMAIGGLSSGLTLIGVRAHTREKVVMLKVVPASGHVNPCPLSMEDKKYSECSWSVGVNSGMLSYKIKLHSKDSDRVELGIQTSFTKDARGNEASTQAMDNAPERQFWFEPGKTLQFDVAGLGPVIVTGEWLDHMPYFAEMDIEHNLAPSLNEIRMISPVLLRGDQVVFDAQGGSVIADEPDDAFWMYVPESGLYALSLTPMERAVRGQVKNNRVSFEIDGQSYQFITGAPVTRDDLVWVLHLAGAKAPWGDSKQASFGTEKLDHLLAQTRAKN